MSEATFGLEIVDSGGGLAGTKEDGVCPVSLLSSKLIILFAMDDRYDYLKSKIPPYSGHDELMSSSMIVNTEACPYLYIEDFMEK